jgi:hypothetical protein
MLRSKIIYFNSSLNYLFWFCRFSTVTEKPNNRQEKSCATVILTFVLHIFRKSFYESCLSKRNFNIRIFVEQLADQFFIFWTFFSRRFLISTKVWYTVWFWLSRFRRWSTLNALIKLIDLFFNEIRRFCFAGIITYFFLCTIFCRFLGDFF